MKAGIAAKRWLGRQTKVKGAMRLHGKLSFKSYFVKRWGYYPLYI